MRTQQGRQIRGACGCCLAPFVILLIAFIAIVLLSSLVWHAATPNVFRWEPLRNHHFDAYRAGFGEGDRIGEQYAARGQREPDAEEVEDLAAHEAQRQHVTFHRREWIKGFHDGFIHGFETFSKEAASIARERYG
ncbi:MAG: hypothetical protein JO354_01085 [Verrucomicrobia bacterium]|nr:hypothetical protein [Verrucomicrobiota bacterium]